MNKIKIRKAGLVLLMALAAAGSSSGQYAAGGNTAAGPVADTPLRLISKQFSFTEGPAVDKQGNIFFTDQPNNKIWKYGTDGKLSVFLDTAGRSNGTYFDARGNLITCADQYDQLWSVSPAGKVSVLVKDFRGARLNGPNDLWIDPGGGIYFTDPYYQRDYWKRTQPELKKECVYYLSPGSSKPRVVADDLEKPNGIVGSPDGQYLYVADIKAGKTYRYRITRGGKLAYKQLFVSQGSDGITLDKAGNLYITGKGVTIYDPAGTKIGHIDVPEDWTANVCFGGERRNQLFITAGKAIYIQPMRVIGVE
ncbi:SMP-30/gluconolactonase/LRE family protein [Compostibacter hankyongensis]|uniref:SMP-30/gluconolactonase/LRE family protein n=1 Tax=Compostibacter hankyongensis TaxID=1007089 RepID=A0ABP8FIF6_9BACT